MEKPLYLIFAGVNGAGKSTFYHSGMWKESLGNLRMPRVNPDEILREHKGDYLSATDQLKAGKEALRRIDRFFEKQKSFNQETTLSGHTAVNNIIRAHNSGYRIILFYIGIDSPLSASKRIEHRIADGGHPIDKATVFRRYSSSMRNFSNVLRYCDKAFVVDNTINFKNIAAWTQGSLSWIGDIKHYGKWLSDAVFNNEIWGLSENTDQRYFEYRFTTYDQLVDI